MLNESGWLFIALAQYYREKSELIFSNIPFFNSDRYIDFLYHMINGSDQTAAAVLKTAQCGGGGVGVNGVGLSASTGGGGVGSIPSIRSTTSDRLSYMFSVWRMENELNEQSS